MLNLDIGVRGFNGDMKLVNLYVCGMCMVWENASDNKVDQPPISQTCVVFWLKKKKKFHHPSAAPASITGARIAQPDPTRPLKQVKMSTVWLREGCSLSFTLLPLGVCVTSVPRPSVPCVCSSVQQTLCLGPAIWMRGIQNLALWWRGAPAEWAAHVVANLVITS